MTAPALQGTLMAEPDDRRAMDGPEVMADGSGVAVLAPPAGADARSWARTVQPALKRGLDIVVAVTVLLLMLPLMEVVALAIVLEAPGPILYRAERVGRGGRPMWMLKFRKMRVDAGELKLTLARDRRLTRVGAVLARTKLDELPQFINVLRGDMSLIGPRPEDPGFVAERWTDYDEILRVRPGITGLSQIAFADESRILSDTEPVGHYLSRIFPQKCALDRHYVQSVGLAIDLRILAWTTIAIVLRRPVAVHRQTGRMSLRRQRRSPAEPDRDPGEYVR
jgi:lipopolysaccharide/colanic/teichoic acid biosynthesis glycosyltransferase